MMSSNSESDMSDFDMSKNTQPFRKKRSRVISSDTDEDVPMNTPDPSQNSSTMDVVPVATVDDDFTTKAEIELHNKMQAKLRIINDAQKQFNEWKVEYQKKFKRPFDEKREVPKMPSCSNFLHNYVHYYEQEPPPGYIRGCIVCGRPGRPFRHGLCIGCISCKDRNHNAPELICDCLWQQPDNCPVDYTLNVCVKCRCFKIHQLVPKFYTSNNFKSSKRLAITQRGEYGFVMDLSKDNVNASKFDKTRLAPSATTAALLVRVMDLNAKDKKQKAVRELTNMLLRFELIDPKRQFACGILRLVASSKVTSRFGREKRGNRTALPSLLELDLEMIPWNDWDSKMWLKLQLLTLLAIT